MKPKRLNRLINHLPKMATSLATLLLLLLLLITSIVSAQQTTDFPLEVKHAFESAMIEAGDLSSQVSWLATYGEITEMETININWETDGPSWRESDNGIELMIVFYDDYNQRVNVDFNYLNYIDEPDSLLQLGYQRTDIVPTNNAYIRTYYDPGSGKYVAKIVFYKNEWTSVYIDVMLLAAEPAEAEAERLAMLLWSRIPENLPAPAVGNNNTADLEINTGEEQAGTTLIPSGDGLTTYPPDSFSNKISNGALSFATGLVALITFFSTLSIISASGITPAEAFNEINTFFGSDNKAAPGLFYQTRDPQEILKNPRLHDQITDANGKQWAYYRRPGDLAGDGWTSVEEYNQTLAQEGNGKFWTDRYGWQTREELYNSEQMAEKFASDNREASIKFNEELKEQQTPPPLEPAQTGLPEYLHPQDREQFARAVREAGQQFEEETDDILKELVASERRHKESVERSINLGQEIELEGKKASFALKLAEDTQKLRDAGYWIRNPYNSYTMQIKNRVLNPRDPKGLQCEEIVDLRYEEVRKEAVEIFGEGVIVDKVVVEERSTVAPQGVIDYLDSKLPYNHTAIRVITPDGKAYIVDNWQALHSKGSTRGLMQPEEKFVEHWKVSLGQNDYQHYSYRDGNTLLDGHDTTLNQFIEEYGPEEGLNLWQTDVSRKIETSITIPDPDKDAYAKQMDTLMKYMKNDTDKIGL